MKKILAIIGILGILLMPFNSTKAQSSEPNFWRKTDDAIYLKKDTWTLGDITNKITEIWADLLHVGSVVIDTVVDGFLHVQTTSTSAFLVGNDIDLDMFQVDTTNSEIKFNVPIGTDIDVGGFATTSVATGNITTEGTLTVKGSTDLQGVLLVQGGLSSSSTISIANDAWFRGYNNAGTDYVSMFKVNTDDEIDVGATLNVGPIELVEDSGVVTLVNLPVSATPSAGVEQSYSMAVDSNTILKVYAEADGIGGIQNQKLDFSNTPIILSDGGVSAGTQTVHFANDTNLGFYRNSSDSIRFTVGSSYWDMTSNVFSSTGSAGGQIKKATGSFTNPTLTYSGDTNTGVGFGASDSVSLIAGANEIARFTYDGSNGYVEEQGGKKYKSYFQTGATHTATESDYTIFNQYSNTGISTTTLPALTVGTATGTAITIIDDDGNASGNYIRVDASDGKTINGNAFDTISGDYNSIEYIFNGTNWRIK
jgi:hypothetical protein